MRNDEIDKPYFSNNDVEKIYVYLTGSRKGITSFMEKAKEVATRSRGGIFIYKDEEALFQVFKSELPEIIKARRIRHWYELVQMIS